MIEIVRLTEANSALLRNVDESMFDQENDSDRLAAFLDNSSHIMLLALEEKVVVGQVSAVIHRHPDKPTELYVDDLAVAERCFRQGIGTLLVRNVSAARGCEDIWVATEPDNEPANGLYRSLLVGERPVLVFDGKLAG